MIEIKKINQLRYAKSESKDLSRNERFDFSKRYSLHVFSSNAIYTFIPKNACSTLRFSLAVANGYLDPESDPNWIHHNIHGMSPLFKLDQYTLSTAAYSFVVLRCPFRRLASAFLDKAIDMKVPIQRLCRTIDPTINSKETMASSINQMTFSQFVENICSLPREKLDEHFRPQVDFLALENYSQWFCLEDFSEIEDRLRSDIQFKLYDVRNKIGHDTSGYVAINGDFSEINIASLRKLKMIKKLPNVTDLYNPSTRTLVSQYFDDDIKLYRKLFGDEKMLFKIYD